MNNKAQKGWLMLLSDTEDSNWGSVDAFYADIDRRRSRQKATDTFDINFKPWGKFVRRDMKPAPGDGFAFYHTTRALFERSDPHRRKARISLIGNLKDIRQNGQTIESISVRIRSAELEAMRAKPIILDETTKLLFRQCGMVRGVRGTYFEVPTKVWAKFLELDGLSDAVPQNSATDASDEELSAFEGKKKWRFILHRKREAHLRAAKIRAALASSSDCRLRCEVHGCGFDFEGVYGKIGHHFAEVHHLKPLSNRTRPTTTSLNDLAIVCANCHRMIHRGGENRPMKGLIQRKSAHPDRRVS